MSSYYPSFSYKGFNSLKDKNLIVAAFDADQGEMDTFLEMEPIYTEKYDGTKRIDYGAKFTSVAVIKFSVIKKNKGSFTVDEIRDFLKWTTGSRRNSYLDLLVDDEIKFSFLGRVTNVYQQKLDSRTIGLTMEFTSVSPWAYSPIQIKGSHITQNMSIDNIGILYKIYEPEYFNIDANGILYNDSLFNTTDNGVIYLNSNGDASHFTIDNQTDDLYTPIYLNVMFENNTSNMLRIKNITLGEETIITDLKNNEIVTLSSDQFIISDIPNKVFGNTFNFVWPRLAPGINEFVVDGAGEGNLEITYRYPIKIGNCAIDIADLRDACEDCCDDENFGGNNSSTGSSSVYWNDIMNKPSTLSGYGITDAYTKIQVDEKITDIDVDTRLDEEELDNMLDDVLGQ